MGAARCLNVPSKFEMQVALKFHFVCQSLKAARFISSTETERGNRAVSFWWSKQCYCIICPGIQFREVFPSPIQNDTNDQVTEAISFLRGLVKSYILWNLLFLLPIPSLPLLLLFQVFAVIWLTFEKWVTKITRQIKIREKTIFLKTAVAKEDSRQFHSWTGNEMKAVSPWGNMLSKHMVKWKMRKGHLVMTCQHFSLPISRYVTW